MANMSIENQVFQLPIDVEASGIVKKTLKTADTYVDKNIEVSVNVPDAEFKVISEGAVTAAVSTTDTKYTSDTETPYAITIAADASVSDVKVGVKTAGFAADSDTVTVAGSAADQATKTLYIKAGSLAAEGSASAEGHGIILGEGVNAAPADGFYIKASAAGSASIATAGWVDSNTQSVSTSGDTYYPVARATLSNTATGSYVEVEGPVLISGDYLYINAGYTENIKVALADLVPDVATVVAADNKYIYKTVSVYDKDGQLVAGSMDDAVLSADGTASATVTKLDVVADGAAFKVSGQSTISGIAESSVVREGFAKVDTPPLRGTVSGTASVNSTLAKVGLGLTIDADNITVTPEISKEDGTAKSGAITMTAPAGRYVAVSTAAIDASADVSPKVTSEGYGTEGVFDATGASIAAGAEASGTYYVPIEAGSHEAVASAPAIVNASATVTSAAAGSDGFVGDLTAGILNVAPSTGEYIMITADASAVKGSVAGTVTCTVTEGYVEAASKTSSISGDVDVAVTAAAPKYIRVYDGAIL